MRKVMAYLHSKKTGEKQGEKEEVEIVSQSGDYGAAQYVVLTGGGVKCTAIFNPFSCSYYADDVYGIIREG